MNPLSLRTLKDIDKKILRFLLENSRQNFTHIAKQIGTSRQNIKQRIKKMEDDHIIQSYSVILNSLIQELHVKAYILLREDPDIDLRKEHEKRILAIPQITTFSRLFGKYDGLIEISVKDNEEVTEIVNKLHALKGIKETETFIVHTTIKNDEKAPLLNLLT